MSLTQETTENTFPGTHFCPTCHSPVPADAAFCGVCGERIDQASRPASEEQANVSGRYRITALIRRRPYALLFRAFDTLHQRPVTICDIDISALDADRRFEAIAATQQEYDLLRREHIPGVMPVIDLRYFQEHLYIVAGGPPPADSLSENQPSSYTLQDLLQSGIGLPGEQTAVSWMYRLCTALQQLHQLQIVPGDLDPNAIIVQGDSYMGQPGLAVAWLPSTIRSVLPQVSIMTNMARFYAPETLQGKVEPASDIYSIGAILYLLLTGSPPDEPAQRSQRPLHPPREVNPRISARVDEVVMRALAVEPEERYQSAAELAQILLELCATTAMPRFVPTQRTQTREATQPPAEENVPETPPDDPEEVTVSIVPIQARMARWYLAKRETNQGAVTQEEEPTQHVSRRKWEQQDTQEMENERGAHVPEATEHEEEVSEQETFYEPVPPMPEPIARQPTAPLGRIGSTPGVVNASTPQTSAPSLGKRFKEQLSGLLPAVSGLKEPKVTDAQPAQKQRTDDPDATLLKRLLRFVLGEQRHSTTAAALIETPLRVQPNQSYVIRIHLMGRSEPVSSGKDAVPVGLSGLTQGECVHIEVRSALYQNYAYIVQRADVHIPAQGFAAEVMMPMQPLTNGPGGRRERLQIYFTDELRRPLYERPFVVEIFISPLVQSGREGHNVLSIPL